MNITSEDEALIELYTNGKTSDKRYRSLPPQVIKGFKKAVDYMKAAQRIEDLFPLKGLNYGSSDISSDTAVMQCIES